MIASQPKCPFLGVKRTSVGHSEMSAYDPLRTLGGAAKGEHGLHMVSSFPELEP
jgi:hypothetical protein